MKSKPNNISPELKELARQLRLDDQTLHEIADDLSQGQNLLNSLSQKELPSSVRNRTLATVHRTLHRRRQWQWIRRAAAVIIIAAGLTTIFMSTTNRPTAAPTTVATNVQPNDPSSQEPKVSTVTPQQRELWEMVLLQQERGTSADDIDRVTMTDLSLMFQNSDLSS